jgi:hypothetical protein
MEVSGLNVTTCTYPRSVAQLLGEPLQQPINARRPISEHGPSNKIRISYNIRQALYPVNDLMAYDTTITLAATVPLFPFSSSSLRGALGKSAATKA